jgi:hypothetical protein
MDSDVKGDAPREEDLTAWHRWFAVECNNAAWQLVERAERTPVETAAMLNAAHAAAFHWTAAGTALHRARANMLLGFAHAFAGSGALAMQFARESFDYLSAQSCPDWEAASLHACMAAAAYASGDPQLHAEHYETARQHGESIADETDRSIFQASFRNIAVPAR